MPASRRPTAPPVVVALLAGVGGILLLVATALPWSDHGAGSRLALVEVGDLLLSGRLEAWAPRVTGLVVYAVPLGGALLLVGAGLGGRLGRTVSVVALAAAIGGLALARAALGQAGARGWGTGALLAVAGATLGAIATALPRRDRPPSATEGEDSPPPGPGTP